MPAPQPATAARTVTLPAISQKFQLSDDNFTRELTEKTLLVLHAWDAALEDEDPLT